MSAPLFALVLSGGSSRRMRTDKALIEYAGRPQLLRTWDMLQKVNVAKVVVSINPGQRGETLRAGLPVLVDSVKSVGPMAGLLTAQQAEPDAGWLVVACDLPLLDTTTLAALIEARAPHCDATAFDSRHDGLPEPLCAIWEPSSTALLRSVAFIHGTAEATLRSRTVLPAQRAAAAAHAPPALARTRAGQREHA